IEGAIFGLLFSAAGGAVAFLWGNWATDGAMKPVIVEWWYGAALGFFVGIAAQAGDLVESGFKRAAGIKDSGHLVPSFGGVMDIMDNFMLTGPLLIVVLALWPA
ncbi:MAG: phosphatidate cytidylyltransferase, partial [Planctomycetes bacterium]|nr:phosphatidate cytidylyltransferase [Planctomycetota bacterium]